MTLNISHTFWVKFIYKQTSFIFGFCGYGELKHFQYGNLNHLEKKQGQKNTEDVFSNADAPKNAIQKTVDFILKHNS